MKQDLHERVVAAFYPVRYLLLIESMVCCWYHKYNKCLWERNNGSCSSANCHIRVRRTDDDVSAGIIAEGFSGRLEAIASKEQYASNIVLKTVSAA